MKLTRATELEITSLFYEKKLPVEIARLLDIPLIDVARTLNKADNPKIDQINRQRRKVGKYHDLEKALTRWYCMTVNYDIPVSTRSLKKKAKAFARKMGYVGFKPTGQWLSTWRNSNSIVCSNKKCRDIGIKSVSGNIMALLQDYKPGDIYAAKEMGINYKLMPHNVLGKTDGCFDNKEQLTLLFATNQLGLDKYRLLVIGENPSTTECCNLPCDYLTESCSRMKSDIFVDWLIEFDDDMRKQKRRIVLILDTSPVHPKEVEIDLTNIKLVFVEGDGEHKNPCDFGISRNLKSLYRREYFQRQCIEGERVMSQLDFFHMLNKAWLLTSPNTVSASFWKAGFHQAWENAPDPDTEQFAIEGLSNEEVDMFVDYDNGLKCYGIPSDDEICVKVLEEDDGQSEGKKSKISDAKSKGDVTVTENDALKVLATLRRFFETNEMIDFTSFYALETQVLESITRKES